jgi:YHS domain-containing protein
MKDILFLVMILFLGAGLSLNTFAQEKSNDEKKEVKTEQTSDEAAVEEGKVFNTICPVSHEEADPEITFEYKGKLYATCCNNCMKKLKADPEKYISKLSEDGKSIVKKKAEQE